RPWLRWPAMDGHVQLWSAQYPPEPTGIGPVSHTLATALTAQSWQVEAVTAYPFYPDPVWGAHLLPATQGRDGIHVLRLPISTAGGTARERIWQEVSFAAGLTAGLPFLGRPFMPRPDVMIAVSPIFLTLLPALIAARVRRMPLVLWLQDILP